MQTPSQVAKRANVSAQTIRNYSADYAALLSPSANGSSGPRLYSERDIEMLCAIAALRKSGVPAGEVAARLQSENAPVIDAVANTPSNQPQEALKAGHSSDLAPQLILSSINGRFEALERRFETRERQAQLWFFGLGLWVGIVVMGAIFFALWIAIRGV